MRRVLNVVVCLFVLGPVALLGQSPTLAGGGYANPTFVTVAPGQIITLFVTGLETEIPADPIKATTVPLPTSLAGISAALNQLGREATPLPMLAVESLPVCATAPGEPQPQPPAPGCSITAISVQFPFDLLLQPEGGFTGVTISENGNTSASFRVLPVSSNLHVLNWGDSFPWKRHESIFGGVVTHADGTPVTPESPARAGETVVIYAYGLGRTTPPVETGHATPNPAPPLLDTEVAIQFDFQPNAMPSNPYAAEGQTPVAPLYVGLTPGQVGLYQINVKIPDVLPPVEPCSYPLGLGSNLTINVGSNADLGLSFGGAQLCVEPST